MLVRIPDAHTLLDRGIPLNMFKSQKKRRGDFMVRVAINGFGRIGRQVFRAGYNVKGIEWVAVNDLTSPDELAYLLTYDSVHGKAPFKVKAGKDHLVVNGKKLLVFAQRDPKALPWKDLKIDVVVESTGFFTKKADAEQHLAAGAKKVLISAPGKDGVMTVVKGVNLDKYDKKSTNVVSNASCTTNCLAPVVKVLNDTFGIVKGAMTTTHSYTADQALQDAPHKDPRRGRAAALNIVPTTTGAAVAVTETIPQLKGKLDGHALRVPTPDGSITDFVCLLKKKTTKEQVNAAFKKASEGYLKGILQYSEEPLVSSDIIGNTHSSIFDASMTTVIDGDLVKVMAWYDNEVGYSTRVVDVIKSMV